MIPDPLIRVVKPISACAALSLRQAMSAAKALSGFVALIHRPNVPVLISDEDLASIPAIPDHSPPIPDISPASIPQKDGEMEQQGVKAIISLAKKDIAEILPGWLVDIYTFESPGSKFFEFVLRVETPEKWVRRQASDRQCMVKIKTKNYLPIPTNSYVVEGYPKQVWGARLPVSQCEMYYARDKSWLLQHIRKRLCEFAHDIRREASGVC